MATWYRTGTAGVTNGSATVQGSGTAWVANARMGEAFRLEGGPLYEIAAVVSDTQLTLASPYLGSTQAGQDYEIVPIKGVLKSAYDAFTAALSEIQGHLSGALAGRFGDGSAGAPSIGFLNSTTTGFFRAAANQIGIATNGVRRVLLSNTALQVDVPITGTAVQASTVDTTAGVLLRQGAHGLGGAVVLTGNTPLKDRDLATGYYTFVGASQPGGPEAQAYVYTLFVFKSGSGRRHFLCWRDGSAQPESFLWNGDQQDVLGGEIIWDRVVTARTGVVGTVSQSAGVPTGRIIERGSNANGDYVKFADGTMICLVRKDAGSILGAGAGTFADPYRTNTSFDVTWPAAFLTAPRVSAIACLDNNMVIPSERALLPQAALPPGATIWIGVRVIRVAGGTGSGNAIMEITAIGRWF